MSYRHIVLFRVFDDVDDDSVETSIVELSRLKTLPGILSWRVERSLDVRKGRVIVEDAAFVDRAAYERFRADPSHLALGELMALISDWTVADYEE